MKFSAAQEHIPWLPSFQCKAA